MGVEVKLSLYMFRGCPYCRRVQDTIATLGVEVELRDIHQHPEHMRDLMIARGRQTVPVLRIEEAGREEWMPESADIQKWLARRFGDGEVPAATVGQRLADWRVWVFGLALVLLLFRLLEPWVG